MRKNRILLLSILGGIVASSAFAAAFQSNEQSATLMGQANAGTTVTTDPSIQYYNPAGMAYVTQPELGLSAILVNTNINFTPTQSTGFAGEPVTGNLSGPGVENYIPAFYYIQPVNSKLTFGIGSEVPFGFETSYSDSSIARYFATESKITSLDINPSFSYKPVSYFSYGGGLVFNYTDAILDQGIDSAGILQFPSFLPQPSDAFIKNDANGWAMGWDAGIEVKPTTTTDVGLAYHSEIKQNLQGDETISSDLYTLQQLFNLAGLQNADVSTNLTLPGYGTLSASQQLTSKWTIMGDAEYIDWSALQRATLNYVGNSPNTNPMPSATIPFKYRNTWRLAAGQSYQIEPDLLLRMGLAWDETPITTDQLRNVRLPDNNRIWATVGATYDINKSSDISFGYAHIFIQNSTSLNTNGLQTFNAKFTGSADLVGLQYNLRFS